MKRILFLLSIMLPALCWAQNLSNYTFGFIGDSQVSVTKGSMPETVAEDLGINIEYYGQSCAYARHYLNTAPVITKHIGFSNVEEINTKNACDVYNYFIEKKPDFMIIALGHNGTLDLQQLVDAYKANGSTVIMVKMFPIKKKKDMYKQYDGMSADIVLDLTDFTVDSGRDGIHPPQEEMIRVGHEIARQLRAYFEANGMSIMAVNSRATNDNCAKAKYGDTLESIANAAGITMDDIYRLNPQMQGVPSNCSLHANELIRIK